MVFTPSASEQSWAQAFLQYLGITPTPTNITQVSAWEQAESGGIGSYNNPLNTTLHEPGSWGVNYNGGDPVQGYPTALEGIQADATALQGNFSHYANIIADLQSGNASNAQFSGDIAASPWGTGGLVASILGTSPAPSATLVGSPSPTPLDPWGLASSVTGGVSNTITNDIVGATTDLFKPLVKPAESLAVRVGLVIFGAIAILIGVATMTKGDNKSIIQDQGGETATKPNELKGAETAAEA